MPLARGAGPYLAFSVGLLAAGVLAAALARGAGLREGGFGLALAAAVALAFFGVFFRDPDRSPGAGIVAPADGRVVEVSREGDRIRLSVFMNVTDVHVNRFPLAGRIESIEDAGRRHRPAFVSDARHNLQRRYRLRTAIGPVEVIQMTGVFARRIVSYVAAGDERGKGDRLGMIRFGSRVDLLLPSERVCLAVQVGDRVRAGVTTVATERP